MALGGQGAPLAPLADLFLLDQANFYLNLGGISNISFRADGGDFRAFDISPCNQIFNALANMIGLAYDHEGQIAASGDCNRSLFDALNNLPYYKTHFPKSIDNNWVQTVVWPMIEATEDRLENKMNTAVLHVAYQISKVIQLQRANQDKVDILITGGGAYNTFLISQIKKHFEHGSARFILPDRTMIEFKEAAMMALMGFLYVKGIDNILPQVTGASRSHIGGCLHRGWSNKLRFDG